jgi:uncharacterized membrane protein YtjA (UPF0391 family)
MPASISTDAQQDTDHAAFRWNQMSQPHVRGRQIGSSIMSLLKWALIFFIVSVIAGIFGFTGISAASADLARILFYIFLVIFIVLLILGITIFRA